MQGRGVDTICPNARASGLMHPDPYTIQTVESNKRVQFTLHDAFLYNERALICCTVYALFPKEFPTCCCIASHIVPAARSNHLIAQADLPLDCPGLPRKPLQLGEGLGTIPCSRVRSSRLYAHQKMSSQWVWAFGVFQRCVCLSGVAPSLCRCVRCRCVAIPLCPIRNVSTRAGTQNHDLGIESGVSG